MANNSSTGGYALPAVTQPLPRTLTLTQFIQTVLQGITQLPGNGTYVRPDWQVDQPKQPEVMVNWIAFGIQDSKPEFNAYISTSNGTDVQYLLQSHVTVKVSIYGPQAYEIYQLLTDGFQVPQNTANLIAAGMGFTEITPAIHVPELISERWFNRYETTLRFTSLSQRLYPILNFVSASGIIYTQTGADDNLQLLFDIEEA